MRFICVYMHAYANVGFYIGYIYMYCIYILPFLRKSVYELSILCTYLPENRI